MAGTPNVPTTVQGNAIEGSEGGPAPSPSLPTAPVGTYTVIFKRTIDGQYEQSTISSSIQSYTRFDIMVANMNYVDNTIAYFKLPPGQYGLKNTIDPLAVINIVGVRQPIHITLAGQDDLDSLHTQASRLAGIHARKGVNVDIAMDFTNKTVVQAQSAPPEASDTPTEASQLLTQRERRDERLNRRNVEARIAETATGEVMTDLTLRWRCRDRTCRRYNSLCYPSEFHGHIQMYMGDLMRWNNAVVGGTAKVDLCPQELLMDLIERHMRRNGKGSAKRNDINGADRHQHIHIHTANTAGAVEVRSSPPVLPNGNDLNNAAKYIHWAQKASYISSTHAQLASRGLADLGYGFESIRDVTDAEWLGIGVPRGAQLAIKKRQKEYIAELALRRPCTPPIPSPLSVVDLDEIV